MAVGLLFIAALLVLAARQDAQAKKVINFRESYSGSTVNSSLSFDGKDFAGQNLGIGALTPGGSISIQDVGQSNPDGKSCTLPGGTPNAGTEFALVDENSITRFQRSGDLLYGRYTTEILCVDFSAGTPPFQFVGSASGVFIGGTGKYEGATGTSAFSLSGTILALPGGTTGAGPGSGAFYGFQATGRGTLIIQ